MRRYVLLLTLLLAPVNIEQQDTKAVNADQLRVNSVAVLVLEEGADGKLAPRLKGTGVVVGDGLIVTTAHHLDQWDSSTPIYVVPAGAKASPRYKALPVFKSKEHDLVVLRGSVHRDRPRFAMASVGEAVSAFSYSYGREMYFEGLISRVENNILYADLTCPIGSSGAGVFNERAELVGISVHSMSDSQGTKVCGVLPASIINSALESTD